MKLTIESTDQLAVIDVNGSSVPARIWEGTSESGTKVLCVITAVAAVDGEDVSKFREELLSLQSSGNARRAFEVETFQ